MHMGSHIQSCLTLCDPMDWSSPGSSLHGIVLLRILEWTAISSSRGSSQHRDWTCISCSSCTGRWILYHWATSVQFSSVQSLSSVQLFMIPWIAARQASLSITNSQSLLKLMSIKLVMQSSHLTLCHPLLLLPPILPSIRVFASESTLLMR